MKLKTKLYVGFGMIFFILIIISSMILYTLNSQKNHLEKIVHTNYERVKVAQDLKFNIQIRAQKIRDHFIVDYPTTEKDELEQLDYLNKQSESLFNDLSVLTLTEADKHFLSKLISLNTIHIQNIYSAVEHLKQDKFKDAQQLILIENSSVREQLIDGINELTKLEEQSMEMVLNESLQAYQTSLFILTILLSASFIVVLIIVISVVKSFSKSLHSVREVMVNIPKHSFENIPRITTKMKDEFADLAKAYNEMACALEKFAESEKSLKRSLQTENWVKSKFAEITTSFQGAQTISSFGHIFISKVAFSVNASYGLLHYREGTYLSRVSAFATTKDENSTKTIEVGEGLVGQCALNNQVILLDNLPSDFIKTKSGLGSATPTHLLMIPITFEKEVLAVLELAKFEPFSAEQIRLLEQICSSIGPNLIRIESHMEIEKLLAKSQALTEELQAQSEELQQQQEELTVINEDLLKEIAISEQKTHELEIIKEDLEQKNHEIIVSSKYKTEFLANMSHELRTPLNSMLILSEILAEDPKQNLTNKQVEYAQTIYSSGKDLLHLINDILDLSKVESGKLDIYPEEVYVESIKAFAKRQFSPVAKNKGLDFDIIIDLKTPEFIITDDQRLKQILKNLLSNAFKFTEKGKIILHIRTADNDLNFNVIFDVIDTGIGIPLSKQESIFEAFSQVDGTTSRNYGGTGLGLSISRQLARLLKGAIKVQSVEGEGTTFSLYLPELSDQEKKLDLVASTIESEEFSNVEVEETATVRNDEFKNKKVLLVDDDMRNVFALTSALEKIEMTVSYAENGLQALKKLEEENFDLVLMDIMMPKMNGYEAIEGIRKKEKLKDLPIIALTAKAMKSDRQKCINAGASDYISKPIDMKQLISLIQVWLCK